MRVSPAVQQRNEDSIRRFFLHIAHIIKTYDIHVGQIYHCKILVVFELKWQSQVSLAEAVSVQGLSA